jgi:hypothetical protein
MENRDDRKMHFAKSEREIVRNAVSSKQKSYDGSEISEVLEGTVSWIGKDSETQSDQYLEECNTHQCGE